MKIKTLFAGMLLTATILSSFIFKSSRLTQNLVSEGFVIDTLVENLQVPWQILFLPDGTMLFTERQGRVRIYRNQKLLRKPAFEIHNLPLDNKSGLLGMCIHPDFEQNKFLYLANNYSSKNKMKLRVTRYIFDNDTLKSPYTIFEDLPANRNHTGCRLVFGPDKKLYVTTGDADQPMLAQDLKAYNGKILRVNDDGSMPVDNPFVKIDSARKEIWSYGHRNPQGLAFQPGTGNAFNSEHGPTGGDEINKNQKGMNYGWPVIHHQEIKDGMISPIAEYTPSIGPAEAMFYNGNRFPQLKGNLLVACLRGESILRIQMDKDKVVSQEVLFKNQYGRIRSLVTGPDGYIYFSTSQNDPPEGKAREHYDMILRMRPSDKDNGSLTFSKLPPNSNINIKSENPNSEILFQQLCAGCHGNELQGTDRAKALTTGKLTYGSDKQSIIGNITHGITDKGMPAWEGALTKYDIDKMSDYILSRRKLSEK